MIFAPPQLMPLLRLLDAETAHKLTIKALRSGLVGAETRGDDPILGTELFGRALTTPSAWRRGLIRTPRW